MESAALPAPFRLIALGQIGSTNDEARRLVETGAAADFTVVTALSQTAGRGRRGRAWVSPPGNLHLSLLLRIDGVGNAAQVGFAAAAALAAALASLMPKVEFRAKWPNDVLAAGRKCAGMLLEPAGSHWLVVGLGVNVAAAPPPEGLNHPACALTEWGYQGGSGPVLEAFCREFMPLAQAWRAEGFAPLRRAWLEWACGLGEAVVARLPDETVSGLFAGLDEDGALLLGQEQGEVRRILAGDVFFPAFSR